MRISDWSSDVCSSDLSVPGRYIEDGVHLRTERPAIGLDGQGRLRQVSFNNYDRAPFLLEPERMRAFYRAYKDLHARIVERANWLTVPLRPGMALVFDNRSEEHTSELQSLMRISSAVFCLKKNNNIEQQTNTNS